MSENLFCLRLRVFGASYFFLMEILNCHSLHSFSRLFNLSHIPVCLFKVSSSAILVPKNHISFSFYAVFRQSFKFLYSFSFSKHFYISFYTVQMQSFFILFSSRNILVLVHHQTADRHRISSVLRDCSYISH